MIELLTQIVILLTAVVGLIKLSGLKSGGNSDDGENHKKMELPSWLNGLGDLIEFASVYAFILIPLGMMYAFMWITNEMSSIGSDETSDTKNVAIIESVEGSNTYEVLRDESEQAFFNIILAKEATTTSIKHELLDKAYKYERADEEFLERVSENGSSLKEASKELVFLGLDYFYQGRLQTAMKRFNQAWLIDSINPGIYFGFWLVQEVIHQLINFFPI